MTLMPRLVVLWAVAGVAAAGSACQRLGECEEGSCGGEDAIAEDGEGSTGASDTAEFPATMVDEPCEVAGAERACETAGEFQYCFQAVPGVLGWGECVVPECELGDTMECPGGDEHGRKGECLLVGGTPAWRYNCDDG